MLGPGDNLAAVISLVEPGGAQLGMLRLAQALRRRGVETIMLGGHAAPGGRELFSRHGFPPSVMSDHAPDLQYACRPEYAEWLRPRLAGASLVHAHMFGSWWAAAAALAGEVPLVASEHNVFAWPGPTPEDELEKALRRVDVFYAHGPDAYTYIRARGFDAQRLRRGLVMIEEADDGPRPELPSPRIVYAGRLNWDKGVDVLVEALALVPACPPAYLLGTGPIQESLRKMIARLDLGSVVHLVGWQDDPARWLSGASVCVVPSRHEAWSQTAVLAMRLGVSVVGTNVEGLPGVLGDRRGVLVPPDDPRALAGAITAILRNEVSLDTAGARAFSSEFTADRVVAEYLDGYTLAVRHRRAVTASSSENLR